MAVLGLTVDLYQSSSSELEAIAQINGANDANAILAYIEGKMNYLATSRPTAVNLFHAMQELQARLRAAASESLSGSSAKDALLAEVKSYAEFALDRDRADCRSIGRHGADLLLSGCRENQKLTVMTICNTGSLATSDYGTALGVVRAVHERGRLAKVVALETRPYNQGSRLTAFEIVQDELPSGTLICDSMAAAMMAGGEVDAVVFGADRVAANGDTANKIGSYSLALVAAAHGVPVYTAAPFTTLDTALASGQEIVIEERPKEELLSTSNAPKTIGVWNPAFDVTPARYLSGIITEKGVIRPEIDGTINVAAFVAAHTMGGEHATTATETKLKVPFDYTEQTIESLPGYLAQKAPEAIKLLGTSAPEDLDCQEVGDGNLNLVFIVTNKKSPKNQVIVKQALPYVRCVGESWPLTLERSYFEYRALVAEKAACPQFVPDVYHFSRPNGLMVMQYLAPPYIILRKGLIAGIRYPTMAEDMGTFCAQTLFKTSGLSLSTTALRQQVEFWSRNVELCALTEQVIFTEPYIEAPNNRWTSPQLDADKKAIESNVALKRAAAGWKQKFVTSTQALFHGDLHSGSVLCAPAPGQTYVIDPEFAFYGPMGFDTGAFVANLLLAYVSQAGHANDEDYAEWILTQVDVFWSTFCNVFGQLWLDPTLHTGFLYGTETMELSPDTLHAFLQHLLTDTLGFAGMKMVRRIVGIAHVEDLESIADADVRATCERRGLTIGQRFITDASQFTSMAEAIALARSS